MISGFWNGYMLSVAAHFFNISRKHVLSSFVADWFKSTKYKILHKTQLMIFHFAYFLKFQNWGKTKKFSWKASFNQNLFLLIDNPLPSYYEGNGQSQVAYIKTAHKTCSYKIIQEHLNFPVWKSQKTLTRKYGQQSKTRFDRRWFFESTLFVDGLWQRCNFCWFVEVFIDANVQFQVNFP